MPRAKQQAKLPPGCVAGCRKDAKGICAVFRKNGPKSLQSSGKDVGGFTQIVKKNGRTLLIRMFADVIEDKETPNG
jgi:hypothetical protein